MNKEEIGKLLDRYARGQCTREEHRRIERHVLQNPVSGDWQWRDERHKQLTEMRIRTRIPMLRGGRRGLVGRFRPRMYAAAAVAVLGLGFCLWPSGSFRTAEPITLIAEAKAYGHDEPTVTFPNGEVRTIAHKAVSVGDLAGIVPQSGTDRPEGSWLTVRVPSRKSLELTLADGSSVWLNAGSSLRFPRAFARDRRDVQLEGEGYFDIAQDAGRPFRVRAGGGEVKVTGTAFNVQAFPEGNAVRTSLVEGRVSFCMAGIEHGITPGEELLADMKNGTAVCQTFDIAQLTSWRDGYFTFDGLDLLEVMRLVSRWYNITAVAEAKPPGQRIGGTFPMDQSLEELLEDLSLLSGARFAIKGKEVRIVR